jgi:hypothetical protein
MFGSEMSGSNVWLGNGLLVLLESWFRVKKLSAARAISRIFLRGISLAFSGT